MTVHPQHPQRTGASLQLKQSSGFFFEYAHIKFFLILALLQNYTDRTTAVPTYSVGEEGNRRGGANYQRPCLFVVANNNDFNLTDFKLNVLLLAALRLVLTLKKHNQLCI